MNIDIFFKLGFLGHYVNENAATLGNKGLILLAVGGVLSAVIAYLLGSLNFAIIISGRTYKQDIRNYGSKNAGMTNMMRIYGKKAAALTLMGDAFKAIAAGLIGYALIGNFGAYIAGTACVIGHMFPVFYKFKGKGGAAAFEADHLLFGSTSK